MSVRGIRIRVCNGLILEVTMLFPIDGPPGYDGPNDGEDDEAFDDEG